MKLIPPALVLSQIAALLLAFSWPYTGSQFLLVFIAWVPMLLLEDHIFRKRLRPVRVLLNAFVFFFVFNLLTTWWIYYASFGGAVMAIVFNAVLMSIPFWLFHVTKRRVGVKEGYVAFLIYWLAFEYLHYSWELSWPWLTMGNVFANQVTIIQWYEITGVAGGTLWILLVNLLFFFILRDRFWLKTKTFAEQKFRMGVLLLLLLVPMLLSYLMYAGYTEKNDPVDIVVVQPNIDPYKDKFSGKSAQEQMKIFFDLAQSKMDDNVDFLVGPETQLAYAVDEEYFDSTTIVKEIRRFIFPFPNVRLVTGMSSFNVYEASEKKPNSARIIPEAPDYYYDHYNAAFQLTNTEKVQIYHKMKLVLGVEKIPFSGIFPFLENFALQMGGTSGSMGMEPAPKIFGSSHTSRAFVAPAICYESIYGEHIAEFVNKGANLLFIITNDGWWDNTPGHKQHMAYARIRAIENRRSIARSANTGISCFINQRGDIIEQTKWWEPAVIRSQLNLNNDLTYYTRNGDFIGRSALFLSVLLLIYTLVRWLTGKTTSKKEI